MAFTGPLRHGSCAPRGGIAATIQSEWMDWVEYRAQRALTASSERVQDIVNGVDQTCAWLMPSTLPPQSECRT
jgi:hypothetical protein